MHILNWEPRTLRQGKVICLRMEMSLVCNDCNYELIFNTNSFEIWGNINQADLGNIRHNVASEIEKGIFCERCGKNRSMKVEDIVSFRLELRNRISEKWRRKAIQKLFRKTVLVRMHPQYSEKH